MPPVLAGPAETDRGGTGAAGAIGAIHWLESDPAQLALRGEAGPLARLAAAGSRCRPDSSSPRARSPPTRPPPAAAGALRGLRKALALR